MNQIRDPKIVDVREIIGSGASPVASALLSTEPVVRQELSISMSCVSPPIGSRSEWAPLRICFALGLVAQDRDESGGIDDHAGTPESFVHGDCGGDRLGPSR